MSNINIKGSSLYSSPIVIGDNNSIVSQNSSSEIDWKLIQDELIQVIGKLSEVSKEYSAVKEALTYALNKDKCSLTKVLKKNSASFLSDIFKGVASGTLVSFISAIIGG